MDQKIFIAGVSGGPDSMCMLDLYKDKIKAVCFVNYHDRDDTHIDQKIVTEYCYTHNIKLHILDVTEAIYEKYPYNNYQDQCRRIRYNFFNNVALKYNLTDVLIAHNYNDFLETAYAQILSNKKNMFLGIKEVSSYKNIRIIRPLINHPKKWLQKYCDTHNIKYMLDKTNSMDIYQRNVNRKLLGLLDETVLKKLIKYINTYNQTNKEHEDKIVELYSEWKANEYDLDFIKKHIHFYQYHLIYKYLSNNFVSRINQNKINQILEYIYSNKPKTYYRLSNDLFLAKDYNKLKIVRR